MALPHRTQILYLADIAFVTAWLDIKRGSKVIEAGTGSGSFSHSVARTIGSSGHLWSYEFHEARATKAREEFARHGMADVVTLTHRNACKDGFTVTDCVDSVFLDLPAPWDAVEHAKKALRKDRTARICCFSPCMEQVLRTVSALNDAGFTEITMYETLLRPHEVNQMPVLQTIGDINKKLKEAEQKREAKRLKQIASSQHSKRKREGNTDDELADDDNDGATVGTKRVKTDDEDASNLQNHSASQELPPETLEMPIPSSTKIDAVPVAPSLKICVSKVVPEVRGHTSYLTFACLLPALLVTVPSGSPVGCEITSVDE